MEVLWKKGKGIAYIQLGKPSKFELSDDMLPFLSQPSVLGCFACKLLSSPAGINLMLLVPCVYTNNMLNISMPDKTLSEIGLKIAIVVKQNFELELK